MNSQRGGNEDLMMIKESDKLEPMFFVVHDKLNNQKQNFVSGEKDEKSVSDKNHLNYS